MRRGFTLIEMLLVIGIIVTLLGVGVASFGKMLKTAERARAQELVSEAATALAAIYEADGMWPKKIREGSTSDNGRLDKDVTYILAQRGYMSLSVANGKLVGKDRCGIVTPWAAKVVERSAKEDPSSENVTGDSTVEDHILRFAVDLDGDGKITSSECGGRTGEDAIRATVAVWCRTKDSGESMKKMIKSWTEGQTKAVK